MVGSGGIFSVRTAFFEDPLMVDDSTLKPAAPDPSVGDPPAPVAPTSPAPEIAEATPSAPTPPSTRLTPGQLAARRVGLHHRLALGAILLFHAALALWMAALRGPYEGYFYDEQFNMENVVQLVTTHRLEPANGWYSLLSYLPQGLVVVAMDELHQRTHLEFLRVIDPEAKPPLLATYNAFLAARMVGIVYGSLSLILVFWLGTRLFSPATGVLAALALAVSPWQIRSSVEFKPDALLMLTTLLAILLMVRFLEEPNLRRYLWVGFGLGLTATAKLNGSFIGPLVALVGIAGALLVVPRSWREVARRVALWGGLAALVAAAVFFITTPYFKLMLFFMGRIDRFYGQRAGISSPLDVVRQAIADMPTAVFLGPVIWGLALVGVLLVIGRLFERGASPGQKLSRLLLVLFPLVYGTVLALTMRYYKHNNLVQFLPFLALLAAVALTTLGGLSERLPRWLGRGAATLVTLAFVAHSGMLALQFSYDENVPHDWQVLTNKLRHFAKLDSPRVVVYEGTYETLPIYKFGRRDGAELWPSVRWLDDASALERARLDLADVVALRKDWSGPQRQAFEQELLAAVPPEAVVHIEANPLRVRGHGFTVIFHQWRFRDDGVGALACRGTEDPAFFRCRLPADFRPGEVAAIHFSFWSKKIGVAEILVGGEGGDKLEVLTAADLGDGKGWEAMSERFVVPQPGVEITLRFEQPIEGKLEQAIPISLSRWIPPDNARLELPKPRRIPAPEPPEPPPGAEPSGASPGEPATGEPLPTEPPPTESTPKEPPPAEPPNAVPEGQGGG